MKCKERLGALAGIAGSCRRALQKSALAGSCGRGVPGSRASCPRSRAGRPRSQGTRAAPGTSMARHRRPTATFEWAWVLPDGTARSINRRLYFGHASNPVLHPVRASRAPAPPQGAGPRGGVAVGGARRGLRTEGPAVPSAGARRRRRRRADERGARDADFALRLARISHQVASEGVEMAVFARRTRVRARRRTRRYVEHPGRVQRSENSQIRVRSRDLVRNAG